jgi:murein L,D-transpeptidase YafK
MKGGKNAIPPCFLCILIGTFLLAGITHGETLPSALISMECQEESYAILVEKHTQKLFLYGCVQGTIKLIKGFPCSTGENSGDKQKRGDKKTPEGIYFFTQVFEDEHLEPRYGVKAFVLDYPNSFDILQKKGGRGIWLHGTDKSLSPNDSRGCIALNNKDILELSHYISLYRTPIIVLKKIEYLSVDEVKKGGEQLRNFTEKWLESWQERDLTSYMSCYDKDFRSKEMNWEQWRSYKDRLNKKYREIDVTIELAQGFQHDNYSLVSFRQDYASDRFKSKGIKRLYLIQNSEEFKIIGEKWERLRGGYLPSQEGPHARTVALRKRDAVKGDVEKIRTFIEEWKTYWENKEIEKYIQCYSDDFETEGTDKQGWKKIKHALNERYKNIKVTLTNAEINVRNEGKEAEVSLLQHYRSDRYNDKGLKTLLLKKEEREWRIVSEHWKPL